MSSTLACQSGRNYVRGEMLRQSPKGYNFDVYRASCDGELFVVKPMTESVFKLSLRIRSEFPNSRRLRIPIDFNRKECTLVYEYFRDDLESFLEKNENIPFRVIKQILWEFGQAVKEFHSKDWIHLDLKPDNIMINWSLDSDGQIRVNKVVLADLDCSFNLEGRRFLRLGQGQRVGHVAWRSPEGQMGTGLVKASDVFAYGLVCLHAMTRVQLLLPDYEQLGKTPPEAEVLRRLIVFFGPGISGLQRHINDEAWDRLLPQLSKMAQEEDPSLQFQNWEEKDFPTLDQDTKRMLKRILHLDPAQRATAQEILGDPWWQK